MLQTLMLLIPLRTSLLGGMLLLGPPPSFPQPPPVAAVQSPAYVLMSGKRQLYGSGQYTVRPIASTTKMLTVTVFLQSWRGSLDQAVPVTAHDLALERYVISRDGAYLPLRQGETLTVEQILQAALLPSDNNAAYMLADLQAGSRQRFDRLLTAETRRLGLTAFRFQDPAGLLPGTQGSAYDLTLFAERALTGKRFSSLVREKTATLPLAGTVQNLNRLLWTVPGALGIKTGYTSKAGWCVVFAVRRTVEGKQVTLVGTVLGAPTASTSFADAVSLEHAGYAWSRQGLSALASWWRGRLSAAPGLLRELAVFPVLSGSRPG